VKVGEGSQVRNSIIFEGVQLGRNVKLQKVIIDKFSRIPDDFTIGLDEDADKKNFKTYGERIRIVPRGWRAG
jgi:glucose-1-phosphate adenylyltransferase